METKKIKNKKSKVLALSVVGLSFIWTTLAWSQAEDVVYDPPLCTGYLDPKNCVGPWPSKPFPKFDCLKNPGLHHCVGPINDYPSKDPNDWEEPKFFGGEVHLQCDLLFKSGIKASFKIETKHFKLQKFEMSPSDLGLITDSEMESSHCRIFQIN